MSADRILVVFAKEMRDSLRDRRTIFMMILLPIVLYPLLFIFISQLQTAGLARLRSQPSRVSAKGPLPADLAGWLKSDSTLSFISSDDPDAALSQGQVSAYVEQRTEPDSFIIYYDGAKERSQLASLRLREVLERYRSQLQKRAISRYGLEPSLLEPFGLRSQNTAPPSRMGAMVLGIILPILLIVSIMMGAMYPAMDLTAGEKERGTMETILTVPVDKGELFLGKFLTVTAISLITGALNLVSIMMTFSAGLIQLGAATGRMEFSLSFLSLLLIFLSLLPLSFFISAVLLSASLFARSFKDAQNIVTPVYLFLFLPTQIAIMPGIQLNRLSALMPVANVTLLFKDIMLGEFSWGLLLLVFAVNILLAFLAVMLSARLFGREEILLGQGRISALSPKRKNIHPGELLPPAAALVLFALVMLLLFYIGGFIQIKYRHWGVLATLWLLLLAPALALAWYAKLDFAQAFHLKPFSLPQLWGTLLLALGAMGLASWLGQVQARIFPESLRMLEGLRDYLDLRRSGLGLLPGLLILALSPGICEEMLFRGLILSSLRRKLPGWLAVASVSFLFALVHLNLFRLAPTFLLGLYLTFIVHRTGSIYLAMIAHAVNNGLVLAVAYFPTLAGKLPWLSETGKFPPGVILLFLGLALAGLFIVFKSSKGSPLKKTESQAYRKAPS